MSEHVVTRFAPSPTGFLHIGGARTALFNWLYAKAHGGRMLLRIEDTDRARSTDAAIDAILDGLRWLELNWDDDPVFQHAQADRHRAVADQLLVSGHAYRCYCSPEDLDAMRERAKAEGRSPKYDGTWRDRDPSEAPSGIEPVIRFRAPLEGKTTVDDKVQGLVSTSNDQLDDLILLRSDGSPTYMLSVVVDDHDMGVTHVIRGDDHLTNAAKQTLIFQALGWEVPVFAHIPLIHGSDGAKLSKRHGALGVEAYRAMGYLPQALRNYLVRLGWSHGDDEIISMQQMIDWFDLDQVGKGAARFDFAKLEHLNGHYIRTMDTDALAEALTDALPVLDNHPDTSVFPTREVLDKLREALPAVRERAKVLGDLLNSAEFLFASRPITIEPKLQKALDSGGREVLLPLVQGLETHDDWSVEGLEAFIHRFVEVHGLKLGKVAQPLRAALTGTAVSPGIYDVLSLLGKEEVLARLTDQTAPAL